MRSSMPLFASIEFLLGDRLAYPSHDLPDETIAVVRFLPDDIIRHIPQRTFDLAADLNSLGLSIMLGYDKFRPVILIMARKAVGDEERKELAARISAKIPCRYTGTAFVTCNTPTDQHSAASGTIVVTSGTIKEDWVADGVILVAPLAQKVMQATPARVVLESKDINTIDFQLEGTHNFDSDATIIGLICEILGIDNLLITMRH